MDLFQKVDLQALADVFIGNQWAIQVMCVFVIAYVYFDPNNSLGKLLASFFLYVVTIGNAYIGNMFLLKPHDVYTSEQVQGLMFISIFSVIVYGSIASGLFVSVITKTKNNKRAGDN